MGASDPQLGVPPWLLALVYGAAVLCALVYGCRGLYRWFRDWRAWRRTRPADDGQPADLPTTLASIDQMKHEGRL